MVRALVAAVRRTRCAELMAVIATDAAIERELRSAGADAVMLWPEQAGVLDELVGAFA